MNGSYQGTASAVPFKSFLEEGALAPEGPQFDLPGTFRGWHKNKSGTATRLCRIGFVK